MAESNDVKLMDKNKLLEILEYLNERLEENQLQLEITVYDGSVMTMVYDNRPATKDIDCVFSDINSKLLQNILNTTQYAFNPVSYTHLDVYKRQTVRLPFSLVTTREWGPRAC